MRAAGYAEFLRDANGSRWRIVSQFELGDRSSWLKEAEEFPGRRRQGQLGAIVGAARWKSQCHCAQFQAKEANS